MKRRIRRSGTLSISSVPQANETQVSLRLTLIVAACALLTGWILYEPAMSAPFIFDDSGLPFFRTIREEPVSSWLIGVRPALMLTYWLNRTVWGDSNQSFHTVNLIIHCLNTALIFLVLWRLLQLAGWKALQIRQASLTGALFFLIHPLQTESVSYVAGRSESLSTTFLLLAYVLFLYRRKEAISWIEALGVLLLFGVAVLTKENAVSLAGLLVLTDAFWPVPFSAAGLRRNWRLYAMMVPAAIAAAVMVLRMLAMAPSAGFSLREFTWYQYAFTQARAIFRYIGFALAPVGQSVDHDFAISRSVMEHGAILWMLLLASVIFIAIRLRRRYPLFCFGMLWFLIALAPTSSIIPISDALVERRTYLALAGLILAGCEASRHVRISRMAAWGIVGAAAAVMAGTCYARNQVWGNPEKLFAEAALGSTRNLRPYLNLTEVLVRRKSCAPAIPHLERAQRLFPKSSDVHVAWGWTLECLGRHDEALQRLKLAADMKPSSRVYEWIGLLYGEMNRPDEARQALVRAVELDPNSVTAHKALGLWYVSVRNWGSAEEEYARSVELDPNDREARIGLIKVREQRQAP